MSEAKESKAKEESSRQLGSHVQSFQDKGKMVHARNQK